MPLSAADRIQSNSGTVGTSTVGDTPVVTSLSNPTSEGSTLVVFIASGGTFSMPVDDPPWALDASQVGVLYAFSRTGVPAGETSWTFTPSSASDFSWRVEEWPRIDLITPQAASATGTPISGSQTIDSGSATTDITDFVALAALRAGQSVAGLTFPAGHSYSNGFAETGYVPNGTGAVLGDLVLATAEAYPGVTGAVSTTLTWDTSGGGSYANLTEYGLIVCYRAAGVVVTPPGQIMVV